LTAPGRSRLCNRLQTPGGATETFTYNNLLQLTRETVPGVMDMQYVYPGGQNDGRIAQSIDGVLNQTVNYTYDALNRLTAAQATGGQWGQAYTFDGFGNLTAKTVTAGSASNWSNAADPATNRLIGQSYDANGNAQFSGTSYDGENRLTARAMTETSMNEIYQYDPSGMRVSRRTLNQNGTVELYVYAYDLSGRHIATITCYGGVSCQNGGPLNVTSQDVYFAGKLVASDGAAVFTDRLGSNRVGRAYLPYGEEQNNPPTADGYTKFATYWRDSTLDSQDYARQGITIWGWGGSIVRTQARAALRLTPQAGTSMDTPAEIRSTTMIQTVLTTSTRTIA